jgi:membrane peptidoglycan carboxypeptidase
LRDYRPQVPLRVFTSDDVLIGEFGAEHREFIPIEKMPKLMTEALLAAEDDQFYNHAGVDIPGLVRAALADLGEGYAQGASTITMQVARNFYLSREKTLARKWYEVLLAWQIDRTLPKDRVLELYMNQVYLGEHAYGFGSAAQTYFGKPLASLSLAETAMLAGLPKAPSTMNPQVNYPRAKRRQEYVLGRMLALGMITQDQYREARRAQLVVSRDANGSFSGHASTWPNWRGSWRSTASATKPIRAASMSTPRCRRCARHWRTTPCRPDWPVTASGTVRRRHRSRCPRQRWFRSMRAPARSKPWWAAPVSIRADSTMPRKHSASRDPRSNRSSIRPR